MAPTDAHTPTPVEPVGTAPGSAPSTGSAALDALDLPVVVRVPDADPEIVVVPDAPVRPSGRGSGLLDLEPILVRRMGLGIVGGVLLALVAIALPLTLTVGWAWGLGVGGQAAFWCGTGFGLIAGAASSASALHDDD